MPVLQASGIGSGIDVVGLVNQLVAAERVPAENRLNRQESQLGSLVSALGKIKSSMSTLQSALVGLSSASAFQARSATSSNEAAVTATATSSAALGSYSLTVNNLATAHKLRSSFGVADTNTTSVGTGTLHISVGGAAATDVAITSGTLEDIRDSVNNSNLGVTAVIINDGSNNYLSFNSDNTGAAGSVNITVTDSDTNHTDNNGLSRLAFDVGVTENLVETTTATDASFTLDGIAITSSSNTVSTAIAGASFVLLQGGGATSNITIGSDKAATKESITKFVDAYNSVIAQINVQSKYVEGGTSGALLSDSMTSRLKSQLQSIVGGASTNTGVLQTLTQLGYSTDAKTGELNLTDSAKLDDALTNSFDDVGLMLEDYATRLDAYIDPYLGSSGLLTEREDGLQTQLDRIEDDKAALDVRIELVRARYTRQFTAMDVLVASLNSTMDYLGQQLANLPGAKK